MVIWLLGLKEGVQKMIKKSWYIWLSIPMFVFLWSNTLRHISSIRRKTKHMPNDCWKAENLWFKVLGVTLKLWVFNIIMPVVLVLMTISIIGNNFVESYNQYLAIILRAIILITLYLSGVYATYKYNVWCKKNISLPRGKD